jgi:CO/xanthine dehydrogenase FAD-binding subunit
MPNVKAYHRPANLNEAVSLLSRPRINTAIIGGGTYIVAHMSDTVDEVVDLQAVGLTEVTYNDDQVKFGAMVRLQTIVEDSQAPALLRDAAYREGPNTFRNAATVGGVVVGASNESELLAALLVFEAEVQIRTMQGARHLSLADFWGDIPAALKGGIVTTVSLTTTGQTASARVGRTPADQPIVAAAARLAPNDQLYLALCGVAPTPVLVDPDNIKGVINPPGDFRGSAEYRRHMAAILAQRVIDEVRGQQPIELA